MSLTAERPSQELLDGLLVDAAWERARLLESRVIDLQAMLKISKQSFEREFTRRRELEEGIRQAMSDHPVTGSLQDDLLALLDD